MSAGSPFRAVNDDKPGLPLGFALHAEIVENSWEAVYRPTIALNYGENSTNVGFPEHISCGLDRMWRLAARDRSDRQNLKPKNPST